MFYNSRIYFILCCLKQSCAGYKVISYNYNVVTQWKLLSFYRNLWQRNVYKMIVILVCSLNCNLMNLQHMHTFFFKYKLLCIECNPSGFMLIEALLWMASPSFFRHKQQVDQVLGSQACSLLQCGEWNQCIQQEGLSHTGGCYNVGQDDAMIWKCFLHCWPFVMGNHWSLVDSPHKGPVIEALVFSLMLALTNCWTNS